MERAIRSKINVYIYIIKTLIIGCQRMHRSKNNVNNPEFFLERAANLLTKRSEQHIFSKDTIVSYHSLFAEYQKAIACILYTTQKTRENHTIHPGTIINLIDRQEKLIIEFIEKIKKKQATSLAEKFMNDTDIRILNVIDLEQLILEQLSAKPQHWEEKLTILFEIFKTRKYVRLELPPNQYRLDFALVKQHVNAISSEQIEIQKQIIEKIFSSIKHSDKLLADRVTELKKELFIIRCEKMINEISTQMPKEQLETLDPATKDKQNLCIQIIANESEHMHTLTDTANKILTKELQIRYSILNYLPEEHNDLFLEYQNKLIKNHYHESMLNKTYQPRHWLVSSLTVNPEKTAYDTKLRQLQDDRIKLIKDFLERYGKQRAIILIDEFAEAHQINAEHQQLIQDSIYNKILPMQKYLLAKIHLFLRLYLRPQYLDGNRVTMEFIEEDIKLITNYDITKFMRTAKNIFTAIPSQHVLTTTEQDQHIQELFFIQCENMIIQKKRETTNLTETIKQRVQKINQAVLDVVGKRSNVQQEFIDKKQLLNTELIITNNNELKQHLEKMLLDSLAAAQAYKEKIQIKKTVTTVEQAYSQIKIAKILSNIHSFRCLITEEQIKIINELNKSMVQMKNNLLTTEEQQEALQQLIDPIIHQSAVANLAKEHLNIKPEGILTQAMTAVGNFVTHPTTQATVAAAMVGWLLGTAVTTIPSSSSLINNILSFSAPYMPQSISNYLQGYLGNNLSINNAANIIMLTTAAGAFLGSKYNATKIILKPLNYIGQEMSDIYNNSKHKSYPNRILRLGVILTTAAVTGASMVGLGYVAAIPITTPIIASVVMFGSLVATVVVAASIKLSKLISNRFTTDNNLNQPTTAAIKLFGNNSDIAEKVIGFLNKKTNKLTTTLEQSKNMSHQQKRFLEKCNNDLNETLELIQNGDYNYKKIWRNGTTGLRKDLYQFEEDINHNKLKNIDPNFIVNSLLNITSEENTQERRSCFVEESTKTTIDFNQSMEQLIYINHIMMFQEDLPAKKQKELKELSELHKPAANSSALVVSPPECPPLLPEPLIKSPTLLNNSKPPSGFIGEIQKTFNQTMNRKP